MNWKKFLEEMYRLRPTELNAIANTLIALSFIKNNEVIIDAGAGIGLVSKNLLQLNKNIKIIAIDNEPACISELNKIESENFDVFNNDLEDIKLPNQTADKIIFRSSLMHCLSKITVLKEAYRLLKNNGQISLFEPILYDKLDRYYEYLSKDTTDYFYYKCIEEKVRNDMNDPLTNYDLTTLKQDLVTCGFKNVHIIQIFQKEFFKICRNETLENANIFYEDKPHKFALKDKFLQYMTQEDFDTYYNELSNQMKGKIIQHSGIGLYIFAQKEPSIYSRIRLCLNIMVFYCSTVFVSRLKNKINELFKRTLFW